MSDLARAADHYILRTEVVGDTLVVTPHGDAGGFSHGIFQAELECLQRLLKSGKYLNLVFDFSGSNYFGSEMIGGLVSLRNLLGESGRAAICEPSDDMRVGLDVMHVDELFEIFDTKQAALRKIAQVSWRDRLAERSSWAWIAAGVAALGLGALLLANLDRIAPTLAAALHARRTRPDYLQVVKIWETYEQSRGNRFTDEERARASKRALEQLATIRESLEQRGDGYAPDRFLASAIDAATQALTGQEPYLARIHFERRMRSTHRLLSRTLGVELPEVTGLKGSANPKPAKAVAPVSPADVEGAPQPTTATEPH